MRLNKKVTWLFLFLLLGNLASANVIDVRTNLTTTAVSQNGTFKFTGNVTCVNDTSFDCGTTIFFSRYNASSATPDSNVSSLIGGTPFYNIVNFSNITQITANKNATISSYDSTPRQLYVKEDGGALYIAGQTNDLIYEFNMSDPYNLSTIVNTRNSSTLVELNPQALWFNKTGETMYIASAGGTNVTQYSLTPAWNISSATAIEKINLASTCGGMRHMFINDSGTALYIACNSNITQYSFSTPWNISTISKVGVFNIDSIDNAQRTFWITKDGSTLYYYGSQNQRIYVLTMQQAWNISNATRNDNYNVSFNAESIFTGFSIVQNDARLFVGATATGRLREYYLNQPGANPYFCGILNASVPCRQTWQVNYTGPIGGNYTFDVYTNSTTGLENSTNDVNIYNATSSCTYSGSGNWNVVCSDACIINTNTDVGGNNVTFTGDGTVVLQKNITNWTYGRISSGCVVRCESGGCLVN